MGFDFFPLYGKNLGSAIESVENVIAKIKSNKFDKSDLVELDNALTEIRTVISEDEE